MSLDIMTVGDKTSPTSTTKLHLFLSKLVAYSCIRVLPPPKLELLHELGELNSSIPLRCTLSNTQPDTISPVQRRELQLFHRRWTRFAERLVIQWQTINYVSAVFVG